MAKNRSDRDSALAVGGGDAWHVRDDDCEIGVDECYNQLIIPASGSKTATLPPVQEAKGRTYHFVVLEDKGGTGFEVEDRDDAAVAAKNYATASNGLEKAGATLHLFCNGCWYEQIHADLS